MKKLLIVLMVVAMASFLFVGCLGTTPPIDPDEPVEPVEPVVPATQAPIITEISSVDFTSALTQYTNKIEVSGVAPTGSVIRIYVNGVNTGIGYAGTGGSFEKVDGTKMALVLDGAKTLYATATEFGLAESAPSTTYTFTLDTVRPKVITSAFGFSVSFSDVTLGYIEVTFNEAVKGSTITATDVWDGTVESPLGNDVPVTVTAKSATVAKLTEITSTSPTLISENGFRVTCPPTITDLAGNELDLIYNFAVGTIL